MSGLTTTTSQTDMLRMMSQMMGNPNGPPGYDYRKPKFIKLLPVDSGEGLPDVIFEDPYTFQPQPDLRGEIRSWGVFPVTLDDMLGNISRMLCLMQQSRYYMSELKHTPEEQFIKVIIERKRQKLLNVDLGDLPKQDIIPIYLTNIHDAQGQPRIWRRVRASAGLKIGVFQDKILCPVMGWYGAKHALVHFTDYRDGSLYGPKDANSVDCVTYRSLVGCQWLPDDEYMLAHLFTSEGQTIGYLYDFGDKWSHEIVVEKILPVDESDGHVEIIAGGGMCPGENMQGTYHYQDFLNEYDQDNEVKKKEKKREILSSPNYKYFVKPPLLAEALASTNSIRSGMRNYVMPMSVEGLNPRMFGDPKLKKGQSIKQTFPDPHDSPGYFKETTSDKKDSRSVSACGFCGKPGSAQLVLKTCGGCRQLLYCSKEHQKEHWKSGHKKVCSREFSK
ncbi:hypothetical protein K435DRAFT_775869 [Dendrothele bispora CBS 962.96]|uniref:MYND-type domain-containing protein n=1 Tax=Dendrothele bispora (strain CBS 962.96) TaxID=1314807 RepID=A0A4S8MHK6_DENBC|nr:hypothetical protein K435DRAFT_775869 [Dendrothele bispora CBS 962.96]